MVDLAADGVAPHLTRPPIPGRVGDGQQVAQLVDLVVDGVAAHLARPLRRLVVAAVIAVMGTPAAIPANILVQGRTVSRGFLVWPKKEGTFLPLFWLQTANLGPLRRLPEK